jgi:hypothetical protein
MGDQKLLIHQSSLLSMSFQWIPDEIRVGFVTSGARGSTILAPKPKSISALSRAVEMVTG